MRDPRQQQRAQFLVVLEHNSRDFALLKRALWKSGATARVWWARETAEAFEILHQLESYACARCLLACLQTPGADLKLIKAVKAKRGLSPLPFAFITDPVGRALEPQAMAAGADAFFVKPTEAEGWGPIARALQLLAASPAPGIPLPGPSDQKPAGSSLDARRP